MADCGKSDVESSSCSSPTPRDVGQSGGVSIGVYTNIPLYNVLCKIFNYIFMLASALNVMSFLNGNTDGDINCGHRESGYELGCWW